MKRKDIISRDYRNDHYSNWWFTRDTKLPYGTFDNRRSVDFTVFVVVAVIGICVLGAIAAGWL